jgi:hypothetical protein
MTIQFGYGMWSQGRRNHLIIIEGKKFLTSQIPQLFFKKVIGPFQTNLDVGSPFIQFLAFIPGHNVFLLDLKQVNFWF